jgi:hypothetical protein
VDCMAAGDHTKESSGKTNNSVDWNKMATTAMATAMAAATVIAQTNLNNGQLLTDHLDVANEGATLNLLKARQEAIQEAQFVTKL